MDEAKNYPTQREVFHGFYTHTFFGNHVSFWRVLFIDQKKGVNVV
jgi:hypothetical protein